MIRFRSALLAASVLSVFAFAGFLVRAQTKPPLTFGAEVSLITVPVFVTDKDGRSVPGLTAADFEIEDGGKPAEIVGFAAVTGDGDVALPNGAPQGIALTARRQFVLLFDLALSRSVNIERARVAAHKFLENNVKPRDLVSVVASTPQGMKTLIGFTPDRLQVARAIDGVGFGDMSRGRDPLGLLYDMNLVGDISMASGTSTDTGGGGGRGSAQVADESRDRALMMMRQQKQAYAQQITTFLGGFLGLARQLDAVRGRKHIILFSEGFDSSIITGATGNEQKMNSNSVAAGALWEVDSDAYFGSTSGRGALTSLFDAMKGSDVVIHSVDLGGVGGDTMALDQMEGATFSSSGLDSLATFAANTGGRFMKGAANIDKVLDEIAGTTSSYYVLAFAPGSGDVGKPRRLKVKLKRGGLNVNHRPSYIVPDPRKPDVTRQALQASEIIAKGLTGGSIVLSAYALPYRSPQLGIGLPVVIQVPGDALTDAMKRKQIALELYGYLIDDQGQVRDYFRATPTLDPAALGARLKESGLQVLTSFAAAPGDFELRLLLRDPESQRFGALRLPVTIPSFPATTFVSAPMFTDDPRARVALPTVTLRRTTREIPFRVEDRPFTVETNPVVKPGSAREICVFKTPSTGAAQDLKVTATDSGGGVHPMAPADVKVARDADGFDRVTFTLDGKGLQDGEYALRVSIGAAQSSPTMMRLR